MTETLPGIANFNADSSKNEFNAPLVSIECETVTSDAIPKLQTIVESAVDEIKKCLDDGLSRTGRKTHRQKLLI
jgi:hypothetical protein